jgi:hypothetical protein
MLNMEFDNAGDVERDHASSPLITTITKSEHIKREIKARRALRRWEDRQNRLAKAARYLAASGRHELAVSILHAIDLREF